MQPEEPKKERSWKKFAIRAIAGGFGFGVGAAVVVLIFVWYSERPKSWDTSALRVKGVRAEGLFLMGEKLEEKSTGTMFTVDLENATGADLTLPQTLTVMQTAKGTGALHGSLLKLDKDYFLPGHHVVSVVLQNDDLCAAKVEAQTCFDSYFKDQSEIVVFDELHKYEVHIGVPSLTPPRPSSNSVPVETR
jgi:hypothetical protein